MNQRKRSENADVRLFDVESLAAYLSIGKSGAIEFARNCGAEKRIGKRLLFDKKVLDKALDEMAANQ